MQPPFFSFHDLSFVIVAYWVARISAEIKPLLYMLSWGDRDVEKEKHGHTIFEVKLGQMKKPRSMTQLIPQCKDVFVDALSQTLHIGHILLIWHGSCVEFGHHL